MTGRDVIQAIFKRLLERDKKYECLREIFEDDDKVVNMLTFFSVLATISPSFFDELERQVIRGRTMATREDAIDFIERMNTKKENVH